MVERDVEKIAKRMVEVGAVKKGSFVLSSGKRSNVYVDVKLACTYPDLLKDITDQMVYLAKEFDSIACIELGGVPLATALSLKTGKRMAIFRKKKKEYGIESDLVGVIERGERVLVVEDVTTTGSSALSTVSRVRELGAEVLQVIVVVDREEGAVKRFRDEGVELTPLLKMSDLMRFL